MEYEAAVNAVLTNLYDGMVKEKGLFWARKVVYFTGMRSAVESINKLISTDLTQTLSDHFLDRNIDDLIVEFIKDSDTVLEMATSLKQD